MGRSVGMRVAVDRVDEPTGVSSRRRRCRRGCRASGGYPFRVFAVFDQLLLPDVKEHIDARRAERDAVQAESRGVGEQFDSLYVK